MRTLPRRPEPTPTDLCTPFAEVVKLCRHIEALERSVCQLTGRIKPYDRVRRSFDDISDWTLGLIGPKPAPTLSHMMLLLLQAASPVVRRRTRLNSSQ